MVYLCDKISRISIKESDLALMPLERIKRYESYQYQINKSMCLASWLLFRWALWYECNIELKENLDIGYGPYGKPYLKEYNEIFFNISHRKECIACAIGTTEIGVDVEGSLEDKYFEMIDSICSANELNDFRIIDDKSQFLTKLWTLKECYVKQIGRGLFQNLKTIDFGGIHDNRFQLYDKYFYTQANSTYQVSVCSKEPVRRTDIKVVDTVWFQKNNWKKVREI